ncbi:hypothetical protein ACJQWK_08869 [Exserohilum turcicum]
MSPQLPVSASCLAHPVSHHRQAQSSQISPRHIVSACAAAVYSQADKANTSSPPNGVHLGLQVAQPHSQPASPRSLSLNGQGASRPPPSSRGQQASCQQQRGVDANEAVKMKEAERVLGPPKGRKTPVLTKAPKIQWDLTKSPSPMPSFSTLNGEVGAAEVEGEPEPEPHGNKMMKNMVPRAGTPIPALPPAFDATQQQSKPSVPSPLSQQHQAYTPPRAPSPTPNIPSLLRVLDANIQPQPHRLSPLTERDDEISDLTRHSSTTAAFFSPSASPEPSSSLRYQAYVEEGDENDIEYEDGDENNEGGPRVRPLRPARYLVHREVASGPTRETDPRLFRSQETLSVRMATVLPVQRVTRSEIVGPRVSSSAGHVSSSGSGSQGGSNDNDDDDDDDDQSVDVREGQVRCRQIVEVVEGEENEKAGRKRRFKARVKRAWARIKRVLCRRERHA